MPDFHSMTDVVGLPIWMIGFLALVIVVLLAIAIARVGSRHTFGFFAQVAASLVLVGIASRIAPNIAAISKPACRR
jgi:hypothetical protein